MEAVEADIVAAVGGGELTVDRVRAEVRALSEGIAAKQVRVRLLLYVPRDWLDWSVDRWTDPRHDMTQTHRRRSS